jgi:hypothetical protein
MIILGFTLVAFGLLVDIQSLWVLGAALIAAGALLSLAGVTLGRRRVGAYPRWMHRTLG